MDPDGSFTFRWHTVTEDGEVVFHQAPSNDGSQSHQPMPSVPQQSYSYHDSSQFTSSQGQWGQNPTYYQQSNAPGPGSVRTAFVPNLGTFNQYVEAGQVPYAYGDQRYENQSPMVYSGGGYSGDYSGGYSGGNTGFEPTVPDPAPPYVPPQFYPLKRKLDGRGNRKKSKTAKKLPISRRAPDRRGNIPKSMVVESRHDVDSVDTTGMSMSLYTDAGTFQTYGDEGNPSAAPQQGPSEDDYRQLPNLEDITERFEQLMKHLETKSDKNFCSKFTAVLPKDSVEKAQKLRERAYAIGPLTMACNLFRRESCRMTPKQMQDFVRDNTTRKVRMEIPKFIEAIAAFRTEPHQKEAIEPLRKFGGILENSILEGEEVVEFTGCTTQ